MVERVRQRQVCGETRRLCCVTEQSAGLIWTVHLLSVSASLGFRLRKRSPFEGRCRIPKRSRFNAKITKVWHRTNLFLVNQDSKTWWEMRTVDADTQRTTSVAKETFSHEALCLECGALFGIGNRTLDKSSSTIVIKYWNWNIVRGGTRSWSRRYSSYEELCKDPRVTIVYVRALRQSQFWMSSRLWIHRFGTLRASSYCRILSHFRLSDLRHSFACSCLNVTHVDLSIVFWPMSAQS